MSNKLSSRLNKSSDIVDMFSKEINTPTKINSKSMRDSPGAAYPGARPPGQGYPAGPEAPSPGQSHNRPGAPPKGRDYPSAPKEQGYP